jgi:vitamin B12 transporter
MIKKACFLVLATVCLVLLTYSEETQKSASSPLLQHNIVVTATRLETPIRELASSVTVITSEDLKRLKKSTVIEAIKEVLSVNIVQNGGMGATSSVFLRGANSEHTLV